MFCFLSSFLSQVDLLDQKLSIDSWISFYLLSFLTRMNDREILWRRNILMTLSLKICHNIDASIVSINQSKALQEINNIWMYTMLLKKIKREKKHWKSAKIQCNCSLSLSFVLWIKFKLHMLIEQLLCLFIWRTYHSIILKIRTSLFTCKFFFRL